MINRLKKIDVAQRQLITAIRLLFDGEDSVSAYSLAANAWEIIDALCNHEKIFSLSNQSRNRIPKGKDLKYDFINSAYRNFFKHADRDPEAILESFNDGEIDTLIFLAVEDYISLIDKSPLEFQVFQLWYMSLYIEKIDANVSPDIFTAIENTFPQIRNLTRKASIAIGKQVLLDARLNEELVSDLRTEVMQTY